MKIFKFGGASVKDAGAVQNVGEVIKQFPSDKLCVVVSAMGKTTNGLERLLQAYVDNDNPNEILEELRSFHYEILNELFENKNNKVFDEVNNLFVELEWVLEDEPNEDFDFDYDQIVSIGELLSTKIVSYYLNSIEVNNTWLDARDLIRTDNTYRNAHVDWDVSQDWINKKIKDDNLIVTQGFMGVTSENFTTTLGREGSDYSAALFAYFLDAESVTIWKDVPGMLNADPKWFDETKKLNHISYREAIELAYYGATVIHPKTIKPLQNKNIPLFVKSFLSPNEEGTIIDNEILFDSLTPSFIFKVDQLLISISPKDFSFIVEENLSDIYSLFADYQVKINIMQNSAINFSVCVDNDKRRVVPLLEKLKQDYIVLYNENLELVTIRHYDVKTIERVLEKKEVLMEQKTRNTARFVLKS
jgi:aspartate kinase